MFNCEHCGETQAPCTAPIMVPTGFRKNEGVVLYGHRLGEAKLCSKCATKFESNKHEIIEVIGGFRYRFLQGANVSPGYVVDSANEESQSSNPPANAPDQK